ncbi:MAG: RNA polymerase sigma factor [Candidatus Zixiibacteriota bacterium]
MNQNRDLFWNLVEREHFRARAFCRKLMGSRDDGDDLYQDCLVCALSRFESLRKIEAFRPWLYRIMINRFKNRQRRNWWKRFLPLTDETAETAAGVNPYPAIAARRRLEIGFRTLSPDEQALIMLHEINGWTISELAEMTGKSEGNVRVMLTRARRKMREALFRFFKGSCSEDIENMLLSEVNICIAPKPED